MRQGPDALAALILADLKDDYRWSETFSSTQDLLAQLAEEARAEYRSGRTVQLEPEDM